MSIFDYFEHLNLSPGQETALTKLEAFLDSPIPVFMLKGYAGSGKTTILKGLIEYLGDKKKTFSLMAPTGRAAKVLRDKTGQGVTIHKAIYNFEKLVSVNKDSKDDAEHSFQYFFPINETNNDEHIIIVDESSMISGQESTHELFTFGTNILLDDLLTFSRLKTSKSKIIFVGDPAQLPPVTDNKSLALEKSFFEGLGISVEETEMTEVLRQADNLILANAKKLRELLALKNRIELRFEFDKNSFINTTAYDIIEKYTEIFPKPEIGDGIIISYSNAQCYHYNMALREKIFPNQRNIVAGDLVLINNNNYHTYGVELFNGDIAKVVDVSPDKVIQSAPVYCDEGGVKVKKIIQFEFRKISIRIPSYPDEIHCFIIDSLLHSINRDLSICEMKALYINFMIRFNDEQKKRNVSGQISYKVGSEEFRQALKNDPFFNALKVKFGYAITCHKAQGGEWDKVFVDYYGRVSLKSDPLRWCYTATTRGIKAVYAINAPFFGKLDKFKFAPIGSIGSIPNEALSLESVIISPYHKAGQHKCKSLKYWEILEKLEDTPYTIEKVESFGDYLERYTIVLENRKVQLQASHKGSGHFVEQFKVINEENHKLKNELELIFNSEFSPAYSINYSPEFDFLSELHSMIQEICSGLDIYITNVVKGKSHYVTYYIKTDSICSYIQFYYNDKGQLTTAMPKTYMCSNDTKIQLLIEKMLSYAS